MQRHKGVILADETLGAFLEGGAILSGPPVTQSACTVAGRALVVETVTDLVTDDGPDPAVVDGVVGLDVEEWRLQDGCWEDDLVAQWVVVGIDRLREHEPLVGIHGAREFLNGAVELE